MAELYRASNEYAFEIYKTKFTDFVQSDFGIVPKFVTSLSNDWIMKNHGFNEE